MAGSLTVTSLVAGYLLSRSFGLEGIGMGWLAGQGAGLVAIGALAGLGHGDTRALQADSLAEH